jgi:hypothetical protein
MTCASDSVVTLGDTTDAASARSRIPASSIHDSTVNTTTTLETSSNSVLVSVNV